MSRLCFSILAMLMALGQPLMAQQQERLDIGGARLDISFTESPSPALRTIVLDWIGNTARAVAGYYQHFPVTRLKIRVKLGPERGANQGTTYGWNGSLITVTIGRNSTAEDFADDWLLTHEMLHLGFPSVPDRHHWSEEGLSTYAEPVARARAGLITKEQLWGDLVRDMPQGQPEASDRGLDFTHTWGRTYWGGAIFWLLADVEIHKRTGNRLGLEHALRAIVNAGGTIEADWELQRAFDIGDKATGFPVLKELYEKLRATPTRTDLAGLWRQLGIERHGRSVTFDDKAPLAAIRQAIAR